jgi:hypothetical protein
MSLLFVLCGFAAIALVDLPGMIRSKRWRELLFYCVLFLLILALGVAMGLGVKIPSPIKGVQSFYQNFLHLSFKLPE